jgi:amino acid transporter
MEYRSMKKNRFKPDIPSSTGEKLKKESKIISCVSFANTLLLWIWIICYSSQVLPITSIVYVIGIAIYVLCCVFIVIARSIHDKKYITYIEKEFKELSVTIDNKKED